MTDAPDTALSNEIAEAAAAATLATPARSSKKGPIPDHFDPALGFFVTKEGDPILPREAKRPITTAKRHDFELDTRSVFEKDKAVLGPVVHRDENGYLIDNAGLKSIGIKPRKLYRRGTHWKVVREGARVEAMLDFGKGANGHTIWSGWSRTLAVGTIIECIGWRRFGKEGLVAPQFIYNELPHEAKWSSVWPKDGLLRPWPLQGMLVEVDAEGNEIVNLTVSSNRMGEQANG